MLFDQQVELKNSAQLCPVKQLMDAEVIGRAEKHAQDTKYCEYN
jgi:hypothetical protein